MSLCDTSLHICYETPVFSCYQPRGFPISDLVSVYWIVPSGCSSVKDLVSTQTLTFDLGMSTFLYDFYIPGIFLFRLVFVCLKRIPHMCRLCRWGVPGHLWNWRDQWKIMNRKLLLRVVFSFFFPPFISPPPWWAKLRFESFTLYHTEKMSFVL